MLKESGGLLFFSPPNEIFVALMKQSDIKDRNLDSATLHQGYIITLNKSNHYA